MLPVSEACAKWFCKFKGQREVVRSTGSCSNRVISVDDVGHDCSKTYEVVKVRRNGEKIVWVIIPVDCHV